MGGGWREVHEGRDIHIYTQMIHVIVQQKLTQHHKATILQYQKKKKKKDGYGTLQIACGVLS